MIILFTDFGLSGPYTGQMKAVLLQHAPTVPFIDLFADAPMFNPAASAQLLAAHASEFPAGSVFLCVVDPGVGSGRLPIVVQADGRYFVGPDNGLFHRIIKHSQDLSAWRIDYRPGRLSASFHGRDLFAPVAAMLANGEPVPGQALAMTELVGADWPGALNEVVYIDHYGNAMTGILAAELDTDTVLSVLGHQLRYARTFSECRSQEIFWYYNANGLVEIAQNRGHAAGALGLEIGTVIRLNH